MKAYLTAATVALALILVAGSAVADDVPITIPNEQAREAVDAALAAANVAQGDAGDAAGAIADAAGVTTEPEPGLTGDGLAGDAIAASIGELPEDPATYAPGGFAGEAAAAAQGAAADVTNAFNLDDPAANLPAAPTPDPADPEASAIAVLDFAGDLASQAEPLVPLDRVEEAAGAAGTLGTSAVAAGLTFALAAADAADGAGGNLLTTAQDTATAAIGIAEEVASDKVSEAETAGVHTAETAAFSVAEAAGVAVAAENAACNTPGAALAGVGDPGAIAPPTPDPEDPLALLATPLPQACAADSIAGTAIAAAQANAVAAGASGADAADRAQDAAEALRAQSVAAAFAVGDAAATAAGSIQASAESVLGGVEELDDNAAEDAVRTVLTEAAGVAGTDPLSLVPA